MELELEFFNLNNVIDNTINVIIGDKKSGKSSLVKHIIFSGSSKYNTGNICTDTEHLKNFYSFLNSESLYKRYSPLIKKRFFADNRYLVFDSYYYNKEKYQEIFNELENNDLNIMTLITFEKFYIVDNFVKLDYIFICEYTNEQEIKKVYNLYIIHFDMLCFDDFLNFVLMTTQDDDILVINCKSKTTNTLFYVYNFDLE